MLQKTKSRKIALLKYGFSAPLFVAMLLLSSAKIEKSKVVQKVASNIELPKLDLISMDAISKSSTLEILAEKKNTKSSINPTIKPAIQEIESKRDTSGPKKIISIKKIDDLRMLILNELTLANSKDNSGSATYSITISENKKISNVELIEGVGSEWEKSVAIKVKNYPDIIDVAPGTYAFSVFNTITKRIADITNAKKEISALTFAKNASSKEKYLFTVARNFEIHSQGIYIDESSNEEKISNSSMKLNPGMQYGKPIFLSGNGSGKPPLFILNGTEILGEQAKVINVNDIIKIEVFKDKVAIDKYGGKGENGAVVITTR